MWIGFVLSRFEFRNGFVWSSMPQGLYLFWYPARFRRNGFVWYFLAHGFQAGSSGSAVAGDGGNPGRPEALTALPGQRVARKERQFRDITGKFVKSKENFPVNRRYCRGLRAPRRRWGSEIDDAITDLISRRWSPDFSMAAKHSQPSTRKLRTDAQRNRERILAVAKEAFTRDGANASLDDVAAQAGVGPGTLYRHFPTRDALIEAVYRTEVEKLAAAERRFAETMPPIEALRAWMLLFVDHIAEKQIIAPALNSVIGGAAKLYEGSQDQIRGAIDALVKRAIRSGEIRKDLDPFDLLRALIGVAHVASSPDWQQSARRLVDILITGSRPARQT